MTDDDREAPPHEQKHISAEDARGGEIILRTRTRRIIFIAGLVGFAILAILVRCTAFG